jgi:subtilisin
MRHVLVLSVFAVLAAVLAGSSPARTAAAPESYVVVYKSGVDTDARTSALERAQGFASEFRYHSALQGFAARLTVQQLANVESDPGVAFVSPDGEVHAVAALASGEATPTGTRRIAATTATTAQGAASVNVAVIDTGIDLNYASELNAVNGKNCLSNSNPPAPAQDDNGHGTHVSGTIAAKNTGAGVVGVAPGTTLYAVKVLNSAGSGTWAQVICGIDWVTANASGLNIKVASMSLGGGGTNDNNCGNTNNDALHKAICNSKAAGVTYVIAAGNSNTSFSGFVPAAYPEAVTVTAVSDSDGQPGGTGGPTSCYGDPDDTHASFSNYAPSSDSSAVAHTVAAPGECINSTWVGGGYNTISGTSMATPHVSGAVALCISRGACTAGGSPSTIISAIRTTDASKGFTTDPNHSPVSGRYYGYIVWLGSTSPPPTPPGAPTLNSATAGNAQVALSWSAPSSSGGAAITNYQIYRGLSTNSETLVATIGTATSYTDTGRTNGTTYYYKVSAFNGSEGPLSNELSAMPAGSVSGVPGVPNGVSAAPANGRGVQVSWSAPSSDGGSPVTGYKIYRGTSSSSQSLLATVNGLTYKDTSAARGGLFYYTVSATNAAGEGPKSAVVSATAT